MKNQNSKPKAKEMNSAPYKRSGGLSVGVILLVVTVVSFVLSFALGRYPVSPGDVVRIFASRILPIHRTWSSIEDTVVIQIRLPRILAALLVGASLAIAGASFQGLFRNPLVSPDILGVSSGASVGAAFAILLYQNRIVIQVSAFCFALVAVALTYAMGRTVRGNPTLSLILAGVAIGSLFTAFLSLIKYVADPLNQLPAITYWLMGSLASVSTGDLIYSSIPIISGTAILLLLRWRLNVLAMGEEEAKALGVDTNKLRGIIIVCCSVVTGASVCISGIIGWVGLVIPHIGRMLVGPNHKVLLPVTVLLGASYLLLIDDIVRTIYLVELPIGILTSIIGAPFFVYLLNRGRWGWT